MAGGWTAADVQKQQAKFLKRPENRATVPASSRSRAIPTEDLADALLRQILAVRLPEPQREYRPFPDRRFRIDLAWVDRLMAVECDGGEWNHGRHGRGAGMASDCEKQNRLMLEGWACLRFVGSQIRSGYALRTIEQALRG